MEVQSAIRNPQVVSDCPKARNPHLVSDCQPSNPPGPEPADTNTHYPRTRHQGRDNFKLGEDVNHSVATGDIRTRVESSRYDCSCNRWSGHAIVDELSAFGARIHVCDISETLLSQSLSEWEKKGFQVSGSVCDVTSRPERETLIQTVSSLFDGKLNILVNNVGGLREKPTTEYGSDDFTFHILINVEAAFHFCQLSLPLL
uniref:3-oxoacyl-[acyl-carrier-protein] reductase n=1 Tax=Brassica oleracea var. oleracea TaxID=109376 RepID=A0A0D3B775_BRAOL